MKKIKNKKSMHKKCFIYSNRDGKENQLPPTKFLGFKNYTERYLLYVLIYDLK